jgi:hypothetical protein
MVFIAIISTLFKLEAVSLRTAASWQKHFIRETLGSFGVLVGHRGFVGGTNGIKLGIALLLFSFLEAA